MKSKGLAVNLEYTQERYCFNTPSEFLETIKPAGFVLLSTANHCMDRCEEGIVRTLKNCRKYGFEIEGLYKSLEEHDEIFVKNIDGIRVAFINYTYGTNAFAHKRFIGHKYGKPLSARGNLARLNTSFKQLRNYCRRGERYILSLDLYMKKRRRILVVAPC